jgi:hypothetical protein
MRFIIGILLFLAVLCLAYGISKGEDVKSVQINKFFGLDVATNPNNLPLGYATVCSNWDFSREAGSLVKRWGYAVWNSGVGGSSFPGQWSGLATYIKRDGTKRLFGIYQFRDTATYFSANPYGMILSTANNGMTFSATGLYPFQYYSARPDWALYNNVLIHSNGQNRPVRYNGSNIMPLIPVAPGTVDVAPYLCDDTVTNKLNGDYYYAIKVNMACDTGWVTHLSDPSYKVHIANDRAIIYAAPMRGAFRDGADTCGQASTDSTFFKLFRTRAGGNPAGWYYKVAECTLLHSASDKYWIDSLVDSGLNAVDSVNRANDTAATTFVMDTADALTYRPGQPRLIRRDTISVGGKALSAGMDSGTVGFRYALMYYDSSTGAQSNIGPYGQVATVKSGNHIADSANYIAIPPVHKDYAGLFRILLRARAYRIKIKVADSVYGANYQQAIPVESKFCSPDYYATGHYRGWQWSNGETQCYYCDDRSATLVSRVGYPGMWCQANLGWHQRSKDSIEYLADAFKPLDTFRTATDTIYKDTHEENNLPLDQKYYGIIDPGQAAYPTMWHDRMYLVRGNIVYYSFVGKPGIIENAFAVDLDDGDQITAMRVYEDNLHIFKNQSWYVVSYDGTIHNVRRLESGVGCVGNHSVTNIPGGGMAWLDKGGVYLYGSHLQSPYKESSGNLSRISDPISRLISYPLATLKNSLVWVAKNKNLVVSFPEKDTSYVFDLVNGSGWGIWIFAPAEVAYYDTVSMSTATPSEQTLFIQNLPAISGIYAGDPDISGSGDTIFVYGSATKDKGAAVSSVWRSGIFNFTDDMVKPDYYAINKTDCDAGVISARFYPREDTTVTANSDSAQYVYRKRGLALPLSYQWQFEMTYSGDSLAIRALDVWMKKYSNVLIH